VGACGEVVIGGLVVTVMVVVIGGVTGESTCKIEAAYGMKEMAKGCCFVECYNSDDWTHQTLTMNVSTAEVMAR
jgi:hypothetical protein